ncbi:MAG: DNA-binding protein [Bacteroidia bacterium]
MIIRFEELRKLKDNLPHGGIKQIATELDIDEQTVRNYFGGYNFTNGNYVGVHYEKGPNGGYVELDDDRIYEEARKLQQHELSNA